VFVFESLLTPSNNAPKANGKNRNIENMPTGALLGGLPAWYNNMLPSIEKEIRNGIIKIQAIIFILITFSKEKQ
jgi:hypothetical protein